MCVAVLGCGGFGEDGVGVFGPGEGLAAVVPGVDVGLDRGDQVGDGGEGAAVDGLAGEDAEEDLDQDVGVKCRVIRGWRASQAVTAGCLWAA